MRVYVPRPNAGIIYAGEHAVNVTSNTVEMRSPHRRRVFVYAFPFGISRLASVEGTTAVRPGVASIIAGGEQ